MSSLNRGLVQAFDRGARLFLVSWVFAVSGNMLTAKPGLGQNYIQLRGQAYSQNFNALPTSAGSYSGSTLPSGFSFTETGSGGNALYSADDGSSAVANTYSYGTGSATDRALGEITSLTVRPFLGVGFVNNTAFTIPSFTVSYTGEQWRLGTADATNDRLEFQYSKNATSPGDSLATWSNVDALDFISPA